MPSRAPQLCAEPGCGQLVDGNRCEQHHIERRRDADRRRPNFHQRGYDREWQKTRAAYLKDHPQCECEECQALPRWKRPDAEVVDHVDGLGPKGPRGHDFNNLMSLTAAHHNRKTALYDGGFGRAKRPTP